MQTTWTFTHGSTITAPAPTVWQRVVTPEGINDEMRPWLTMSLPRGVAGLSIDNVETGRHLGRAWLRVFGVLPFDFDHLMIARLEPGRRFVEESTMLSMRKWGHDRTVEPLSDSHCRVTDRVSLQPRLLLRPLGPVLARVMRAFFAHRHRRLSHHFSAAR